MSNDKYLILKFKSYVKNGGINLEYVCCSSLV